jgi:fermentation-respiration switch protein FrsA (DUF1100 family)
MLTLVLTALAGYAALVGLLFFFQRSLLYPAARGVVALPADLPGFSEVSIATPDGERLLAWWKPPGAPDRPTVLFLHGNGGSIPSRAGRAKTLSADGAGLLLLSYRGYASSTGRPSEEGLNIDALAAFDWIAARQPGSPIAVFGESLGSGVGVRLATERPVAGLILDAPYTSIVDVAAAIYWFVPVRALLQDRFPSIDRIGALKVPILILHGERDGVVPFHHGEQLFAAAPNPKRFVRIAGGDHMGNLESAEGHAAVKAFLAQLAR